MPKIALAVAALLFGMGAAFAQTPQPSSPQPPAAEGPGNNAINKSDKTDPAPVAGANSFTEAQAKSRMEQHGFTNVSDLKKDDSGVWRATATKNGKPQTVSVDFKGNVIAQ